MFQYMEIVAYDQLLSRGTSRQWLYVNTQLKNVLLKDTQVSQLGLKPTLS